MSTDDTPAATALAPAARPVSIDTLREIVGDARVVALGEGAHFVREFADARADLTQLLLEHMGFTVVAAELGVAAAFDLDPWIRGDGADGDLATIGPDAVASGHGRLFRAVREHNRGAATPARLVGIDVPDAGGSLLPALRPVRDHLADVDPGLLPRLDDAIRLAERFAARSAMAARPAWLALETAEQDALTAAMARLRALMHARRPSYPDREGLDRALLHLDVAIGTDHLFGATHGLPASEQMMAAVSLRDSLMADAVLRHLERAGPDERVVIVAHNTHVQRTPLRYWPEAEPTILPMGLHLAGELGDDYVAVALTHTADAVPEMRTGDTPGVAVVALDPPAPTSVEAAAAGLRDTVLVGTRGLAGTDRIRAQSGWSHTVVADAFDAVLIAPTATLDPDVEL